MAEPVTIIIYMDEGMVVDVQANLASPEQTLRCIVVDFDAGLGLDDAPIIRRRHAGIERVNATSTKPAICSATTRRLPAATASSTGTMRWRGSKRLFVAKSERAIFYGAGYGPHLPLGVLRNGEMRWVRAVFNKDGSFSHATMDVNSSMQGWPEHRAQASTFPLAIYLRTDLPTRRREIELYPELRHNLQR